MAEHFTPQRDKWGSLPTTTSTCLGSIHFTQICSGWNIAQVSTADESINIIQRQGNAERAHMQPIYNPTILHRSNLRQPLPNKPNNINWSPPTTRPRYTNPSATNLNLMTIFPATCPSAVNSSASVFVSPWRAVSINTCFNARTGREAHSSKWRKWIVLRLGQRIGGMFAGENVSCCVWPTWRPLASNCGLLFAARKNIA